VMGARRSIKSKTIFNMLGPVTNPLEASHQLTGIYDEARTEMMAEALGTVGTRRAIVVAGSDGLDEITITGPSKLTDYNSGRIETRHVLPEDFGLPRAAGETLAGGDAEQNARLLAAILEGEKNPLRDCILANASAALVAAGKTDDFKEGAAVSAESIDSGKARETLKALAEFTEKHRR
jgi:anthranilate phosphoribosyltransferase